MAKRFSSPEEKAAYYKVKCAESYARHKDDPGRREKSRERARLTQERNRERAKVDPEFAEKMRVSACERSKAAYRRARKDPERVEQMRAQARARHHKKPKHPRVLLSEDEKLRRKREHVRAWQKANPEKARTASLAWAKKNYGKVARNVSRYRAMLAKAPGSFTEQEWLDRVAEFNGCCAFCLQPCDHLTVEHMQELSSGGSNEISNIVPACHSCNSRKRDRGMLWMASRIAA